MNACPDDLTLERWLAGALDQAASEGVRTHAESCDTCRVKLAAAADDERSLDALRRAMVADALSKSPSSPQSANVRLLPESIAGFKVVRLLAEGGMGTVYEVEQDQPKRSIALKVLKIGAAITPERLALFEREIEALGRLNHPGIATSFAGGATESGEPFLAMELVQGLPIDRYADEHHLTPAQCALLVARLCDAVQHAHDQGVIHRDIKPSNILVTDTGQPKLLDFGLARVMSADLPFRTIFDGSGGLMGTLGYMSPEQVRGDPARIDNRSDVYALGSVLYRLVTGQHAVLGENLTPREVAARICDGRIVAPSAINHEVPPSIDRIVMQAMNPEPDQRPASAAELGVALHAAAEHPQVVSRSQRAGSWRMPLVLILAAGLAVAATTTLVQRSGGRTQPQDAPAPVQPPGPVVRNASEPGGVVLDMRVAGPPKDGQQVQWVWTYIYIVGDAKEAWGREKRYIETNRARRRRLQTEQLIRAGAVAEAAGEFEAAMDLFDEAMQSQGRFRFEAKTRAARLLSNWKGCEAAADAIANLERTAKAPKGEGTLQVAYAWLVIAGHHARCGSDSRVVMCLTDADEAMAQSSSDAPRDWFQVQRQSVQR